MSTRRWFLSPSITLCFALAFMLLLASAVGVREALIQGGENTAKAERALQLLDQTDRVLTRLVDAETGQRGYLLTGAERDLAPYDEAVAELPVEAARLHDLCAGNPDEARLLARLDPLMEARIDELRRLVELRRSGGSEAAPSRAAMDAGKEAMDRIRAVMDALRSAGGSDLRRIHAGRQAWRERNRALTSGAIFDGAVLAGVTLLALNRQTRRRMLAEEERDRSLRAEVALEERARAADALRESEEELRALFMASSLGKGQIDPARPRFTRVNPRLCEITGYTEAELLLMRIEALTPPESREADMARFHRSLKSDAGGYAIEKQWIRKDGVRIWVQIDATFLRDARGRISRVIVSIRDVTASKAAEAEREELLRVAGQARAHAEAANRAKDEFLAVLSHEMRSPLHATLGWLSILKKGLAGGRDVSRAVETVERNARLQAQLVNDLLDVSRIVSGKLMIAADPIELSAVVRSAVESARPAAEAKGVALSLAVALPGGFVLGDEPRLCQVVGNLLANAVKFTPSGGRVSVTLDGDGDSVTLQVRDTGAGIAPGFLPHVFERFRQADATSTRAQGGLGIGLYLVKTLVDLHGGRVLASSDGEGKGAAFNVRLPLQGATSPRPAAIAVAAVDPDALAGVTVVLVEDDPDSREALRLALEHSGAKVYACGSAAEARGVLEDVRPGVIVSDIGMPGEDGHAFLHSVRASFATHIPAVAITGFASRQDREEAVRSGFDDHIPKPVHADVLVAKLREMARRSGAGVVPCTASPSLGEA